jgi:hypothetical protein
VKGPNFMSLFVREAIFFRLGDVFLSFLLGRESVCTDVVSVSMGSDVLLKLELRRVELQTSHLRACNNHLECCILQTTNMNSSQSSQLQLLSSPMILE